MLPAQACQLNAALCYLKMQDYPTAAMWCDEVLAEHPIDLTALYRRGLAKEALKDYDQCVVDFETALRNHDGKASKNVRKALVSGLPAACPATAAAAGLPAPSCADALSWST